MIRLENLYGNEDWARGRLARRNQGQDHLLREVEAQHTTRSDLHAPSPLLNASAAVVPFGSIAGGKRGRKQGDSISSLTTPEQLRRSITLTEATLSKSNRVQVEKLNKLYKIVVHGNIETQISYEQVGVNDSIQTEEKVAAIAASKAKITQLMDEVTNEMQKLVELTDESIAERSAIGFRMTLHPGSNKRAYSEIVRDEDCKIGSGVIWNLEKAMELLGNAAPLTKRQRELHEKLISGRKVTKRMREAKYSIHTIE